MVNVTDLKLNLISRNICALFKRENYRDLQTCDRTEDLM